MPEDSSERKKETIVERIEGGVRDWMTKFEMGQWAMAKGKSKHGSELQKGKRDD